MRSCLPLVSSLPWHLVLQQPSLRKFDLLPLLSSGERSSGWARTSAGAAPSSSAFPAMFLADTKTAVAAAEPEFDCAWQRGSCSTQTGVNGRTSPSRSIATRTNIGVPMKNCKRHASDVNRTRRKQTVPLTRPSANIENVTAPPSGTRPAKEEQSLTCFHVGSCLQWHIDQERLPILMNSGHGLNS